MADMTPTPAPLPLPAPAVRELLAGGEAVVRVRMEPQPCEEHNGRWSFAVRGIRGAFYTESQAAYAMEHACPWKPGETVDVLEPWGINSTGHGGTLSDYRYHVCVQYRSDDDRWDETRWEVPREVYAEYDRMFQLDGGDEILWRDAATMPPWAVRLALAITAVGVARAEGAWWWEISCTPKRKGRVTT